MPSHQAHDLNSMQSPVSIASSHTCAHHFSLLLSSAAVSVRVLSPNPRLATNDLLPTLTLAFSWGACTSHVGTRIRRVAIIFTGVGAFLWARNDIDKRRREQMLLHGPGYRRKPIPKGGVK
jgi:hypothetical protein